MSFAAYVQGSPGQEKETHTAQKHPLGTVMVFSDGRQFRYCENGGVALASGKLVQMPVPEANHDELAVNTAAAGDDTLSITLGATAAAANLYRDGWVNVEDDTGEGHLYKIKSHPAVASAAEGVFTLEDNDPIKVAFVAATTVGLVKNPYKDVIVQPSPPTAAVVGCACTTVPIDNFCWIQTTGPASVLTDGTLVLFEMCMTSDAVDGAVEDFSLTEAAPPTLDDTIVGRVIEVAVDTEYSVVWLQLD